MQSFCDLSLKQGATNNQSKVKKHFNWLIGLGIHLVAQVYRHHRWSSCLIPGCNLHMCIWKPVHLSICHADNSHGTAGIGIYISTAWIYKPIIFLQYKPAKSWMHVACDMQLKCVLHVPHLSKKHPVTCRGGGTACLNVCQFINCSEDTRRTMQLCQSL